MNIQDSFSFFIQVWHFPDKDMSKLDQKGLEQHVKFVYNVPKDTKAMPLWACSFNPRHSKLNPSNFVFEIRYQAISTEYVIDFYHIQVYGELTNILPFSHLFLGSKTFLLTVSLGPNTISHHFSILQKCDECLLWNISRSSYYFWDKAERNKKSRPKFFC